jgi:pseudaminic acid cytidylyltransferase
LGALAIIPARGGSKRIPRKNVKPFAGRPMLSYAVEAARASGLFTAVVVSTDDAEIADIARSCGAHALARPAHMASDEASTTTAIAHAISAFGADGEVCCIYPCVPLLRVADLLAGLALLRETGAAYSFPVCAFPSAPQRALRLSPARRTAPLIPDNEEKRTQELEPAYYDAGQFYWARSETWLADLPIHSNGAAILIERWRAIDIDLPEDWEFAEKLYRLTMGAP